MAKVIVEPGVCGFTAEIEAISEDGMEVKLTVDTGCPAIIDMIESLGDTYDGYEVVFAHPGANLFYQYATEHNFPQHGGCVTIAGITKAIEAACSLALPTNASITFVG